MSDKRYKCKCSECGHTSYATKSIFQTMGILDRGMGRCLNCKTFLNLIFDEEKQIMVSRHWEEYVKEVKSNV